MSFVPESHTVERLQKDLSAVTEECREVLAEIRKVDPAAAVTELEEAFLSNAASMGPRRASYSDDGKSFYVVESALPPVKDFADAVVKQRRLLNALKKMLAQTHEQQQVQRKQEAAQRRAKLSETERLREEIGELREEMATLRSEVSTLRSIVMRQQSDSPQASPSLRAAQRTPSSVPPMLIATAMKAEFFSTGTLPAASPEKPRKTCVLPPMLPPRGLSRVEAAQYIGVSPSLFDVMVKDGRMPPPKPINARKVWDRLKLAANRP
jgi:hypothetical protein